MKIWGTGPFENEVGAAFAQEVVQDGEVALAEAFDVALDPDTDFLAAEEGWRAVAAAGVLDAALNGATAALTDAALRAWVEAAEPSILAPLREGAQEALARVLGPDSELPELWEDGEDAAGWRATVQQLRASLS
ncbi:DUF4259 domain-containing protein [Deinococcus aerophilus]|uniref:DUF4259 domain-containing protein n=1 Tax=Deinococcus aerophilus TaxID=522488 RepID=A0ABQ2GT44_9DEIO|nr:DUF4259 domain-containing protein [Deinococcus aerophilus]GGM09442.1 hypothetical protein GCM10010841_17270 [Deinococcus aerophilus]